MPAKKSDWKRELGRLQTSGATGPTPTKPEEILGRGKRTSVENTGLSVTKDQMLKEWDDNLRHRERHNKSAMEKRIEEAKKRNPKSMKDRLKGLFGGD